MSNSSIHHPASYRDPSGFIFEKEGILYRQVNIGFKEDFDHFVNSGCYETLVKKELLIPHETIKENLSGSPEWYLTLRPEKINFISYPYEWCFDMLKDAALLSLQLVKESIAFGVSLKDASPFNIQWHNGKLIFIDTLSFEKYKEQEPWIAYRQFCENFLGPLLLMHHSKNPLHPLALGWPEGIPLAIISSLLPPRTKFHLHTYLHIHLHARLSSKNKSKNDRSAGFSKQKLLNLISSLEGLITRLRAPRQRTTWSDYYDEAGQRKDYLQHKKEIIQQWLEMETGVRTAADLGANDGVFSRLLSEKGIRTLSVDADATCINNLYIAIRQTGEKNIQPLVTDLSNPGPAAGVNNKERSSFRDRTHVDLVMALALVHHLAIGKNITFTMIADLLQQAGKTLIIEFIPKDDEKIKKMLRQKKDIYTGYTEARFLEAFEKYFRVLKKERIADSNRVLYLMKKNEN